MLPPLTKNGVPHWQDKWPESIWPLFEDFRVFLAACWDHLGLPEPTEAQYEIAHVLQHGVDSSQAAAGEAWPESEPFEMVIRAFRGLGKSYTTSAYVSWLMMRNPRDEKVLVTSATSSKAKEFVDQTKGLMQSMPLLQWLLTGTRDSGASRRDKTDEFDVAGASLTQSHSVTARGISGQITGSRATTLIADDIEIENNSLTEEARAKLIRVIADDFNPITKTEHGKGDQILLGTPRVEESVYNYAVQSMGFRSFCIPARYPSNDKLINYQIRCDDGRVENILAPYLRAKELKPLEPTDTRFPEDELIRTEAKGRTSFALQYMLDTSLSDAERFPLKQNDLIVMAVQPKKAPITVQWGRDSDKKNFIRDIPNLGFRGDQLLRPLFVDTEWAEYEETLMYVDPAGRGADETSWAVASSLAGMIFVHEVGGFKGDPATAMEQIAFDAYKYQVERILIEPNYASGVWSTSLRSVVEQMQTPRHCPTVDEADWAKGQKELRILGALEPVMASHRLIVDEVLIRREAAKSKATEEYQYSLMYQMTHLTKERNSLKHDDRVEALSGVVQAFEKTVGENRAAARKSILDNAMEEEIADFVKHYSRKPVEMRNHSRVQKLRGRRKHTEVYRTRW